MTAYYNEIDPYAAQWLGNLIADRQLPAGDVDTRSIVDVKAADLKGYAQAHFFAGIGGWSLALRTAGWADDRPVWTGSCPCQPFSAAGKRGAQQDKRHLWPAWFNLIKSVQPPVLFGEQVAGAIAHGWLDDAFDDLEREGYETAAAVLPACSVGAPHKRDRLWFVGYTAEPACEWRARSVLREKAQECGEGQQHGNLSDRPEYAGEGSGEGSVADTNIERLQGWNSGELQKRSGEQFIGESDSPIPNSTGGRWKQGSAHPGGLRKKSSALQERSRFTDGDSDGGHWQSEPAVGRVANGIPARAHKLRAYGNAIVPQVAAEFIKAYLECRPDLNS